ncbi:hypothetical protein ANN_07295 [Periplaneta americana]|uniref:Reverse transcriptase domain-containing protein n=1 Tax=Periplaneta americana TaxID=6978 RepID=A0ABQ8TIA3_PERAM|nr:hypothetical protein ANN_07295 [Periplaneta americana]
MALPALLYGRENWALRKKDERRIEAVEMKFLSVYIVCQKHHLLEQCTITTPAGEGTQEDPQKDGGTSFDLEWNGSYGPYRNADDDDDDDDDDNLQKAFDRIDWNKLMGILKKIGVDWKERRLFSNVYMKQRIKVRLGEEMSEESEIEKGVQIEIKCLRFADDMALLAEEEMILRDMLLELNDSCEQYGMKINANKTKTIVIGRKIKKVNLRILNEAVEQVDSFKYLGCTISSNMSCCQEVKRRIAMAKEAFNRKRSIFCGPLEKELRKNCLMVEAGGSCRGVSPVLFCCLCSLDLRRCVCLIMLSLNMSLNCFRKMQRWAGRVAVVTGASSGIGAAITKELVKSGVKVVGLARRVERVEELSSKLSSEPGKLFAVKADITKESDIKEAFQWVKKNLGGVDILVNNAGVNIGNSLTEGPEEAWKGMFDLNVFALSSCTKEAIQSMKERNVDDGHIVHINRHPSCAEEIVKPVLILVQDNVKAPGTLDTTDILRGPEIQLIDYPDYLNRIEHV